MKTVSPLFCRLTTKKILFPCVHTRNISRLDKIYFGGLLGGKILQKTNVQNACHKLEEKWLNSVVFKHIRAFYFDFMFGDSST